MINKGETKTMVIGELGLKHNIKMKDKSKHNCININIQG